MRGKRGWGCTAHSWWAACVCCWGSHHYGFLLVPALIDGYEIFIWRNSVLISSHWSSPSRAMGIWNAADLGILNGLKVRAQWLNALHTHVNWERVGISVITTDCPLSFPSPKALWPALKICLHVVCVWVTCMCVMAKWKLHSCWICKLEHLAEGLLSMGTSLPFWNRFVLKNHLLLQVVELLHGSCTAKAKAPLRGSLLSRLQFEAAQYLQIHKVASLAIPGDCLVHAQSLLSIPHRKETGLPGPVECLSKPVKSTNHPAAEHAYSWPFASFDLRIRPHHECPYCHVMCTQCVNYWK